jgi:hypothetical protein
VQRNALDAPALNRHDLEAHVEGTELGVAREPSGGRALEPTNLLRPDGLPRMAEAGAAPRLDLADDEPLTAPSDHVELVPARACVRAQYPVAAEAVIAPDAAFRVRPEPARR